MKIIAVLLLSLLMGKSCQTELAGAKVTYTATTRGFFTQLNIEGNTLTVSRDRSNPTQGETTVVSEANLRRLAALYSALDLEQLPGLQAPSNHRATDRSQMAWLEVSTSGKTYKSAIFDHGNPPAEISEFVNFLNQLAPKK